MSSSVSSLSSTTYSSPDDSQALFGEKYMILERHQIDYADEMFRGIFPCKHIGLLIAGYVVEGKLFDREYWRAYFGVDIGEETGEIRKALAFKRFYRFYHGPNPLDMRNGWTVESARQICESILIPTIVPKTMMVMEKKFNYHLYLLGCLANHPKKGHAAKYTSNYKGRSLALKNYGTKGADRPRIAFLLKDSVPRDRLWTDEGKHSKQMPQEDYLKEVNISTEYVCETKPGTLELTTVVVAHHLVTGQRYCGDGTGLEGRCSYIRTGDAVQREEFECRVIVGAFRARCDKHWNPLPAKLTVDDDFCAYDYARTPILCLFG